MTHAFGIVAANVGQRPKRLIVVNVRLVQGPKLTHCRLQRTMTLHGGVADKN